MKTKLPPDHEISQNKSAFAESVDLALNSHRKTAKITVRDKLRLVNDELIKFKDTGISYRIICALLADKIGLYVSQQTLRDHCQQELGFGKRETGKSIAKKTLKRTSQATGQGTQSGSGKTQSITDERGTGQLSDAIRSHSTATDVKNQITEQTNKIFNALEDY
ncbi:hypothetical protein [Methylotuvimicrobium buryatense]|uniref:Uncharacterized protein n=1 Tax=Methylotuvimicrobium buryatense TaxID=95641 RepID=A0A4P9UL13_METBY|nr:hypothetical protein [Methylotuvimicrobium buryatense]QCW81033.1 hypothetical protein EQU24_01260 [Methylotuvimicrobium buryatense]